MAQNHDLPSELKPCPLCSGDADIFLGVKEDREFVVRCGRCGCSVRGYSDPESAVAAWNTRANDPLVKQLIWEGEILLDRIDNRTAKSDWILSGDDSKAVHHFRKALTAAQQVTK